jgi:hypothetical protein|tara:strand:+ start:270 stop:500 length:231 start_codon:yes stop_codon:yes gene_type:complete
MEAQDSPKTTQENPKTAQESPKVPQEAPRGSPGAPLQLSWSSHGGSLEQALCPANLSFIEVKPRVVKMDESANKIS